MELLHKGWNRLSPLNLKKWEDQAQKVDDAEFTTLLDEEWDKLSAKKKEDEKARQDVQESADRAAGAATGAASPATGAASPATGGASFATGADAHADVETVRPLEQTITATAAAAVAKKVWAQKEKDSAKTERAEDETKKAAEPKVKKFFRDKTTQQSTTNDSSANKVDRDSAAFRDKARVAGRCVVPGGLCVSPLTTRNLAL